MSSQSDGARSQRVLLRGGSVYTPAAPFATAMFVADGTVAWVGEDEAAQTYLEAADRVIELDGRLVTPGFVDAHVHLAQTGFALQSVDLGRARSLTEALELLARYAASFRGSVLFAQGWDETAWPEGRPPTIGELDRAVGGQVAYVARVDSHSAVISSALLAHRPELSSLDGWTPDGRVERDAHHAARQVTHELWTAADREQAIREALRHAASRGITSVHELNAPHIAPYADFDAIRAVTARESLPEVVPYWGELWSGGDPDETILGYAGDLCMDGAIGSRTAAMLDPYADADTRGHLYLSTEQVRDHVVACTRSDKQAGFHVIGDAAVREVAAGFRAAAALLGADALIAARHRLEHVEMPDDETIKTLADLGIVASVQPAFDAAWGASGQLYDRRLGSSRSVAMNPFATMHRAGVALAFGSDSPITPLDPWGAIRAATFHHLDTERLTARAAFNAHTRGGHRARRRDGAGVLTPGAEATYAIWDVTGDLMVQTPDERVASWSTDARAGVPVLPDLSGDTPLPGCVLAVIGGVPVFDPETAFEKHSAPDAKELP